MLSENLTRYFGNVHNTLHGWCTEEKARKMVDLVLMVRPTLCVEVGVWGGRSLYPTALALQCTGSGTITGVDPWSAEASLEGEASVAEKEWWGSMDHESMYRYCLEKIVELGISAEANLLRLKSEQAAGRFVDESIDILHIDGNHSVETSTKDVALWIPKVVPGGYIWFDDCNWQSTQVALTQLTEKCQLLANFETYALYRKPKTAAS